MTRASESKPELILHVGFAKTGSSSIQQTFSRVPFADLADAAWGAPGAGSGVIAANHSGAFRAAFVGDADHAFRRVDNGRMAAHPAADGSQARGRLKSFLETCTKPRVMISAEDMTATRLQGGVVQFRDFVRPLVSRTRVFGYVRPHADLSASQFQQRLKRGITDTFPGAAASHLGIAMIDETFGQDNVTLIKYDRETLAHNDVVLDLADRLGVRIPPESIKTANESLSLEAVAALYCHFKHGKHRWDYKGAPGFIASWSMRLRGSVRRVFTIRRFWFWSLSASSLLKSNWSRTAWAVR